MEKISAITIPFYKFKCPDNLLLELKNLINDEEKTKFKSNTINLASIDFVYPPVVNWINECLNDLKVELWNKDVTFKISVVDYWINKSYRTKKHHKHLHPNSMFSGILYLTNHEKNSETRFYIEDPWHRLENKKILLLEKESKFFETEHLIRPVEGDMVIFPSHISHDTAPNIDKFPRLTLSFNAYVTGTIGDKNKSTYLNTTSKLYYE